MIAAEIGAEIGADIGAETGVAIAAVLETATEAVNVAGSAAVIETVIAAATEAVIGGTKNVTWIQPVTLPVFFEIWCSLDAATRESQSATVFESPR